MSQAFGRSVIAGAIVLVLAGCEAGIPKAALQLDEQSMADRQMQTRRFETSDERMILAATAALLQDLGFTLDESETDLGVVVASKDRSAVEAGQVAGAIFLAALTGTQAMYDTNQRMRASVVTRPIGESGGNIAVRVTFQRIVWNNYRQVSKAEALNDPDQYREFFEKLSKSVFLEAHEI